jgi:molybdopterin molybdotransferase
MLTAVSPLGGESAALDCALGRTLAAPVAAMRAQPPFAASAMDGYALRAADTPGTLRIVGESAAGHAFSRALACGEAVRISTGAPLPDGADAVLIQEDAKIENGALIAAPVEVGRHVRPAGCDFAAATDLLEAGRQLDPVAIALTAAAGHAQVQVAKRPRVTILSGGDEVVAPGAAPRGDQIFDSCSYAIAALAEQWGAIVVRKTLLPDDAAIVEAAAKRAIMEADLVVFVGAASVGPHDHAKPAFEKLDAQFLVRKVDMRPGKPTWFATTPGAPVLGLPGNPASALVAAILFLGPVLSAMQGGGARAPSAQGRLLGGLPANGAREAYLRGRVGRDDLGATLIEVFGDQDSSLLSVFARANALIVRPAHAPAAAAGDTVCYLQFCAGYQ